MSTWEVNFVAPLLVGISLWLLAEVARSWFRKVNVRRTLRRRIISLMGRASAVVDRAVHDGKFETAYIEGSNDPLEAARWRYDELTAEALDLFEPGEERVAFWAMVEFYGGWYSPLEVLRRDDVPKRPDPQGLPLLSPMSRAWIGPRATELARWANVRTPWDRGIRRGPQYGTIYTPGDQTRHSAVPPNSDSTDDLLWPYVLRLNPLDRKLTKREWRALERRYGPPSETDSAPH